MDWFDALVMGIVQGLAEYLPISSSGHLEIFNKLLGLDISGADSLQFDILLHVATILSTVVVLWREFSGLCVSFFCWKRDAAFMTVMKILLSCIPILVVGAFFKDAIENFFGGNLMVVGTCLCITAALLAFAYFTHPVRAPRGAQAPSRGHDISFFDAFVIGCAQAVAVLPGLSRSGATIATGILLGDSREKVAKFSFLMVIIPILGAAVLDILKALAGREAMGDVAFVPCLVGFLASFVVGCIACRWMIELVKKGRLVWFALYCVIVGLVCILAA